MSPAILTIGEYRFYFYSREESRPHVHVQHTTGEVKIWLDPVVAVAVNRGLSSKRVVTVLRLVEEHQDEISIAWQTHFGG